MRTFNRRTNDVSEGVSTSLRILGILQLNNTRISKIWKHIIYHAGSILLLFFSLYSIQMLDSYPYISHFWHADWLIEWILYIYSSWLNVQLLQIILQTSVLKSKLEAFLSMISIKISIMQQRYVQVKIATQQARKRRQLPEN